MSSLLDNASVIHDQNPVGPADGGQAMSNHDAGATRQRRLNGLFQQHLGFRIDIGGCFVQHQQARVPDKDPGQGEELLLA